MTMKPDLLSLKHMCCQVFAIRFWRRIQIEQLNFNVFSLHRDAKIHFDLKDWISMFGLPKTAEEEMHNVIMAFGQSLSAVSVYYLERLCTSGSSAEENMDPAKEYMDFFFIPHLFDSIVPSPRGGILEKETCQNLLQDPRINSSIKYDVARFFWVHDPEVSSNVIQYREQMAGDVNYPAPFPKTSFLNALDAQNYRAAKHYWSMMSMKDKLALSNDEMIRNVFIYDDLFYGDLLQHTSYSIIELLMDCVFMHDRKHLLLSLYEIGHCGPYFYKIMLPGYFKYHSSPFGGKTDKFIRLLEDSLPEDACNLVIDALMSNIIRENKRFLYTTLVSFWERRSNEFKESFRSRNMNELSFIKDGYMNIIYATRCLSFLQPVVQNIKLLWPPENIASAFESLCLWREPLEALDNYIKLLGVSDDEVAMMKRNAMETASGKQIIRDLIIKDNRLQDAYNILKHTLATETDVNQYISLVQDENEFPSFDDLFLSD